MSDLVIQHRRLINEAKLKSSKLPDGIVFLINVFNEHYKAYLKYPTNKESMDIVKRDKEITKKLEGHIIKLATAKSKPLKPVAAKIDNEKINPPQTVKKIKRGRPAPSAIKAGGIKIVIKHRVLISKNNIEIYKLPADIRSMIRGFSLNLCNFVRTPEERFAKTIINSDIKIYELIKIWLKDNPTEHVDIKYGFFKLIVSFCIRLFSRKETINNKSFYLLSIEAVEGGKPKVNIVELKKSIDPSTKFNIPDQDIVDTLLYTLHTN